MPRFPYQLVAHAWRGRCLRWQQVLQDDLVTAQSGTSPELPAEISFDNHREPQQCEVAGLLNDTACQGL